MHLSKTHFGKLFRTWILFVAVGLITTVAAITVLAQSAFEVTDSAEETLFKVDENGDISVGSGAKLGYEPDVDHIGTWEPYNGTTGNMTFRHYWSGGTSNMVFIPNDHVIFNTPATGNVGIGTSNPTEKLEVNGNVLVDGELYFTGSHGPPPPDYVFEEDYPLMPLDQLQAYLIENKHLPHIPSAEEIRQEGLNLSEFQMKLLEKIEELTLYMIAQEEKIQAQQVVIEQQNREITQIKEALQKAGIFLR